MDGSRETDIRILTENTELLNETREDRDRHLATMRGRNFNYRAFSKLLRAQGVRAHMRRLTLGDLEHAVRIAADIAEKDPGSNLIFIAALREAAEYFKDARLG